MKKEIFILSFIRMFTAAGFVISIPFLNIFLYNERGIPLKIVGLYITLASLIGAVSRIYSGKLSDKFSSILVMNLGHLFKFLAFIGFSLLVSFPSPVFLFFFAFTLNSIGFAFIHTASDAYVGEIFSEKDRPKNYGILRIGTNLGWALGPAFGGFLANMSYLLLFILSSFLALFALFLNIFFIRDKKPYKSREKIPFSFKEVLKDKNFLLFLMGSFTMFVIVGQLITSLPVFARDVGLNNLQVGYLFCVNGLMVVFFQYPVTVLIKNFSNKKSLIAGTIFYSIGYFSFSFFHSFYGLAVGVIILTIGEMIVMPLLATITTILAPSGTQGTYLGLLGFIQGIGGAFSPLIAGIFIDAFIKKPLYLWTGISLFGISGIIFYLNVKKTEGSLKDRI